MKAMKYDSYCTGKFKLCVSFVVLFKACLDLKFCTLLLFTRKCLLYSFILGHGLHNLLKFNQIRFNLFREISHFVFCSPWSCNVQVYRTPTEGG